MNIWHAVIAIVLSGIAVSLADWFFGGVLFHSKYMAHPEIWRRGSGVSENKAIAWSIVLGFFSCAIFVVVYALFEAKGYAQAFAFALAVWLIAPLPLLITNWLFIKMHPLTVVAHSLGWLAKLCAMAAITASLVGS
jgi:hypothetical protein